MASRRMAACMTVVRGHPSRRIAHAMLLRMRFGDDPRGFKPNRKLCFRAIAQAILQALAFKHSNPTQPSSRGRGHITGSPVGVRNNCR
jgi:hypothetical protein